MRCSVCAAELLEEAVFCHQCGAQVADAGMSDSLQTDSAQQRFRAAVDTVRANQEEPERELWQGRFSKLAMIGSWIGAAVFSIALLVAAAVIGFGSVGWTVSLVGLLLIWVGLAARLFYRQLSEHYFLTSQRFIHEKGLLWRESDRIEAIDIDDVSFQQGPVGRMLGVGTIQILSSDQSHPVMELQGIEKVREVAAMIDDVRRQERHKRGLHIESV